MGETQIPAGPAGIAVVWDRMQLAEWRLGHIVDFCSQVTERAVWEPYDLAQEILELARAT